MCAGCGVIYVRMPFYAWHIHKNFLFEYWWGEKREHEHPPEGLFVWKKLEANARENLCLFTFKACRRKLDLWFLEESCVWNIKSCKRQQCHLEEKMHLQSRFQLIPQFTSTWHHHTRNNFSISIPIIRDEENLSKQH